MSGRATQRPPFTLHDLKDAIVSNADVWGTPATIGNIRQIAGDRQAWNGDCIPALTMGGFAIPSPHGLLFADFSPITFDQKRVILASLEAIAAARAIKHPSRAEKYNFAAMLKPLKNAIRQVNTHQATRYATGILACLFDIADLPKLGHLHRIQANEAMIYAWSNRLDPNSLQNLLPTAEALLNAVNCGDQSAPHFASAIRNLNSIEPTRPPQRVAA